MRTANLATALHRLARCGAVMSLLLVLPVVAASQDGAVVSKIEATISTGGSPQDGYIEVVLGGRLLGGREALTIRAVLDPDEYPPAPHFGSGHYWRRLERFLGHLEFYRGATLVDRVDSYTVGIQGVSHTPSGILDVHLFTWGGGASQPGTSGILRYDLALGTATTRFYATVPEGRQDELWNCTESEQLWPVAADPGTRRVAFAPCGSRVDAVEEREQAARDLLAAVPGVLDVADVRLRPGERIVLACDGCASLGGLRFRELLAASGVAVERARSAAFEVARVEHWGFSVYDSFSAVFLRRLAGGAWQGLYGETYHYGGVSVSIPCRFGLMKTPRWGLA